jgi:hypothetical protein
LQQAFPVSQIDENDAAVVTPALRPARNRDELAGERIPDLAAVVSTHNTINYEWEARDSAACNGPEASAANAAYEIDVTGRTAL